MKLNFGYKATFTALHTLVFQGCFFPEMVIILWAKERTSHRALFSHSKE